MSHWKRVGVATVVSVSLICSIPAYAKGKPDNPGKSGDAPGNSGNAPGQSGGSPGKSGSAPGQIKEVAVPLGKSRGEAPGQVKNERYDSLDDFINSNEVKLNSPLARSIISNSAEHEKLRTEMEIILFAYKAGLISKIDAEIRTKKCLDQMGEATRPGKFLGFMFRCRGILCQ